MEKRGRKKRRGGIRKKNGREWKRIGKGRKTTATTATTA